MIEVAARQERWRCIERDDDDGDDDDGEKHDHKINSKSTFCPPQSRKGPITYVCVNSTSGGGRSLATPAYQGRLALVALPIPHASWE